MVVEGDQLYIGRYLVTGADAASLYLEVKSKTATEIVCEALNEASLGGLLTVFHMERNQSGLANKQNQQPLFAEYDIETLGTLAAEFDIDFLSLSYTRTGQVCTLLAAVLGRAARVAASLPAGAAPPACRPRCARTCLLEVTPPAPRQRTPGLIVAASRATDLLSYAVQDVLDARVLLDNLGLDTCRVIAKLDAKSALVNFRSILNAADGIMLSRGNLGLDCLPEKVAVIQKNVTTMCNLVGKPCIVTRIVDTMVNAPRPTRAEATDVANAVLDGCDCMMLGAETLRGMDPANAVSTVVACCHAAEAEFNHSAHFDYLMREAAKAEAAGIAVPGGAEDGTPESSAHGSSAALAAMAQKETLSQSVSHMNLATSLRAMTRNNPQSGSQNSSLSALRAPCLRPLPPA